MDPHNSKRLGWPYSGSRTSATMLKRPRRRYEPGRRALVLFLGRGGDRLLFGNRAAFFVTKWSARSNHFKRHHRLPGLARGRRCSPSRAGSRVPGLWGAARGIPFCRRVLGKALLLSAPL